MLAGCDTVEQHCQKVQRIMDAIKTLHSAEGLAAAGLEYRTVFCPEHRILDSESIGLIAEESTSPVSEGNGDQNKDWVVPTEHNLNRGSFPPAGLTISAISEPLWSVKSVDSSHESSSDALPNPQITESTDDDAQIQCHLCHRRLFHIDSNIPITLENRQKFIADGDMYEAIADLCQDYAHEVMCKETDMEWVPVEKVDSQDEHRGETGKCRDHRYHHRYYPGAICALVNSKHPRINTKHGSSTRAAKQERMVGRPTVLVGTGGGKVRAGIFSRQHLMCNSIEASTALPILREAKKRRLNVVIPDQNVRGERLGYETFCKTLEKVFSSWVHDNQSTRKANGTQASTSCMERDLYILSHSASGAHMQRYFMDHGQTLVADIRAIAFTDSTHNIQWAKCSEKLELYELLESSKCVYFRYSNKERDSQWYLHATGDRKSVV